MTATYDFTRVQGNTLQFAVRFRSFDATGSTFVFRARSPRKTFVSRTSQDGGISVLIEPDGARKQSTLSWSMTPAESRTFGTGRVNQYEIERRIGGAETTLLMGFLTLIPGVNDDV